MLDSEMRRTILLLSSKGNSIRAIARMLTVSRNSVRKVLKSGSDQVPDIKRGEVAESHLDDIRELYDRCKGNLVRVQEELLHGGIDIAYSTLTAACRRHGIGQKPKIPKGRYHFEPGEEMQHDTSPHDVLIGGKKRRLQCASLVLCYSRMQFSQLYPTFNRFYCKVFLTEALRYFDGVAGQCMVDNTSVIVAGGSGKNAIIAPEMVAFAERFGFKFVAHEIGDANRSARVEGPFNYIERNFYPGRTFKHLVDANDQMRVWCQEKSQRYLRTVRAHPIELYACEKSALKRLPGFIPEVYRMHHRLVDLEGYVHVCGNTYSMPADYIGMRVQVRETRSRILIFQGPRCIADHQRENEGRGARVTLPEHCPKGRRRPQSRRTAPPLEEERIVRASAPEFSQLLDILSSRHGRSVRRIRRLHRMYLDYPTDALKNAVAEALTYGLCDLARIERMTLRRVAGEYFKLPITSTNDPDDSDHG